MSPIRGTLAGRCAAISSATAPPNEKPTMLGAAICKMIHQFPQCGGESRDGVFVARRQAVSATREIGNNQAKSSLEGRHLKGPIGSAASESMNEEQRLTAPAYQVVNR